MSDVHALVGAYAIDALDDGERAEFERHLAECAACRAEVDGLREAAALIGTTSATAPPEGLRDRVLADIAKVRPLPPVTERETAPAATPRRRFRPRLLAAAAAALVVLGGGAVVVDQVTDDSSQGQQPTAADRIRAAGDAQTFTQAVDGGGRATVIRSRRLNQAVVVTDGMPAAPDGKVYELWLVHGDDMVPAGLMPNGVHEVLLEGDPATAGGFGITVEPDGGSEEPTLPPIAQIAFGST